MNAVLDLDGVTQYTTLSASTWQKLVRENQAPKPRLLAGRRVGWLRSEIDGWLHARPVADLPPPANCGVRKKD